MSKKSERLAQLQKHRIAESQRKSNPASAEDSAEPVPARRGFGNPYKRIPKPYRIPAIVVAVLVVLSLLSGLMSLIFPATVPVPSPLAASIVPPVEIQNASLLPIYRLRYECQFTTLIDQSGFSFGPQKLVPDAQKMQPILYFHDKIPVECVGGMNVAGIRIKSVEFRVTMSYFHVGWPFRRHVEYTVRSEFETGRFRWMVE